MVLRSLAVLLVASVATASAQVMTVSAVRVGVEQAQVMTRPSPKADVMAHAVPGTTLEALDKMNGWYWVLLERDSHGTQRAGWIHESTLEGYVKPVEEKAEERAADQSPIVEPAKAEKPRKTDDRKLRKMEQELERARQNLERLQQPQPPAADAGATTDTASTPQH